MSITLEVCLCENRVLRLWNQWHLEAGNDAAAFSLQTLPWWPTERSGKVVQLGWGLMITQQEDKDFYQLYSVTSFYWLAVRCELGPFHRTSHWPKKCMLPFSHLELKSIRGTIRVSEEMTQHLEESKRPTDRVSVKQTATADQTRKRVRNTAYPLSTPGRREGPIWEPECGPGKSPLGS